MILAGALVIIGAASIAYSHCQVPCGIYGDETRFKLMREHVTTIEKSMKEIVRISADSEEKKNNNQLVRWVANKEDHVAHLSEIVTHYFMAQRVKPVSDLKDPGQAKYCKQITLLHEILVTGMKAKQTTKVEYCAKLRSLIDQFEKVYTSK